jgi:Zn ribbon nucleic-acid-binding protein
LLTSSKKILKRNTTNSCNFCHCKDTLKLWKESKRQKRVLKTIYCQSSSSELVT